MKILWLEQMTKEGSVSEKARNAIYSDCIQLMKVAAFNTAAADKFEAATAKWLNDNKAVVGMTTAIGAPLLANFFMGKLDKVKEAKKVQEDIAATRAKILTTYSDNRQKAQARFDELVKFAPSVARNFDLASRVLKEKIHSGFTSQDVQSLAQIQATYTPDMTKQMKMSDGLKKTASSEKRLGETLAAVVYLCKEASISGAGGAMAGKVVGRGIKRETLQKVIDNTLMFGAPASILAVGSGIVNAISGHNEKKKMEAALTDSFEKALKGGDPDRDGLSVNKEKARQAFQILAHFSPHVAMQPDAARSFMSKMIHYDQTGRGSVQVEDIKNLTDIQKNHSSGSRGSRFFEGFASAAKVLGVGDSLKSGLKGLQTATDAEVKQMALDDLGLPQDRGGRD